jgi:hypothetical protein
MSVIVSLTNGPSYLEISELSGKMTSKQELVWPALMLYFCARPHYLIVKFSPFKVSFNCLLFTWRNFTGIFTVMHILLEDQYELTKLLKKSLY